MGITETKLNGQMPPDSVGNGLYKVWNRNRNAKQGGGVMLLIKENLKVKKVIYGEDKVEMITLRIESENVKNRDFIITRGPFAAKWLQTFRVVIFLLASLHSLHIGSKSIQT